ncbi:MAG: glycine cleavage system aminomethyltransferase GcvT [Alphaproteobacteria bacterium]
MNRRTPLYDEHVKLGAKIAPFAGYDMPIDYKPGVMKEHEWTRSKAGLFDVSHMGQAIVEGEKAAEFFSTITPSSFLRAPHGRAKYTVLTNERGGIVDDLIITRMTDTKFFVVYNAGRKDVDVAHMKKHLPTGVSFTELADNALLALQGPLAESALSEELPDADLANLGYMTMKETEWKGARVFVSRLGYTGEDGFEISISQDKAPALWSALLNNPDVLAIGLAARDSLRLEMGYPLYGHDLSEETTPVEAALSWVMSKGHDAFIGAKAILGVEPKHKRVGIRLTGAGIAREESPVYVGEKKVGTLSSGGFSPTLKAAIGQGYIDSDYAKEGQAVEVEVRGRRIAAIIAPLSFVPAKTKAAKQATPNLKSA